MQSDCTKCHGTGWVIKPAKTGTARAFAERCNCISEDAFRQRQSQARIPKKFAGDSFKNFEATETGPQDALNACRRLVESYPEQRRGILLMGSCGVGKTHLAVATLKGLLEKGADGLFYDFRDLLDELRGSYDPGAASESAILHRVFSVEVLVLDELGSEKMTDWVREIVHRVVIRRYNDEKLTIFTTNYLDPALLPKELSNDPLETLEGRIGYRLRSRLYEMCDTVPLGGKDFRRVEQQARRALREVTPVQQDDPLSAEECERSFLNLPPSEQEPYLRRAREKFRGMAVLGRQQEQAAIGFYREDLLREMRSS